MSHTFIEREIRALRARGVDVRTLTIRRAPDSALLTDTDRQAASETFAVLPVAPARLLRAHLRAAALRPSEYLRTLRSAVSLRTGGVRSLLWQVFYFGEAIVVWDECRRQGVTHIHAHFANVASAVARLASRFGRADGLLWSFTMHGPTEFENVSAFALPAKVESAAFVACISDFCRSQLLRLSPPTHWSKLIVVRCGLELEEIDTERSESRERDVIRVLSVGRLVPEKGQRILLEAAAELRRRGIDACTTIVGDGPEREELQRAAEALALKDEVVFAGALGQDRVQELLRAADVFCLPSFAEGLPVVLMEAMAHRLPVVTTRIAGVGELVEDHVSGYVVAPGRADEIANALDALARDPGTRARFGQAGRERVARDYQVRNSAERLQSLFEHAAQA